VESMAHFKGGDLEFLGLKECKCVTGNYQNWLTRATFTMVTSGEVSQYELVCDLSFVSAFLAEPFFKRRGGLSDSVKLLRGALQAVDTCDLSAEDRLVLSQKDSILFSVPGSNTAEAAIVDAEGNEEEADPDVLLKVAEEHIVALEAEGVDSSTVKAGLSPGGGKVVGDPHVENLKGEKFDILVTGRVKLLEYPRRAVTSNIRVNAFIARVGKCEQTFIEQIDITGTWLPEASPDTVTRLSFAARPGNNHSFVVRRDQAEWAPAVSPVSLEFPQQFKLEISINQHHRWNFLELHAHGIGSLQDDVGGILGYDSHDTISMDSACEHSRSTEESTTFQQLASVRLFDTSSVNCGC